MYAGGFDEIGLGYGVPMHQHLNNSFSEMYRCYSVTLMQGNERQNVNFGGKIILPPSALAKLASLEIEYPMLFELRNQNGQQHSHAGVLEFIAEEGRVYLPYWMMQTLLLDQGDIIEIKSAELPLGTFVKIQPQTVDFLDISDPKAVLENAFRNFSTLTQGDLIQINYNNKIYEILVLEVRPGNNEPGNNGISIVETDLEVDFAPPVGYVEPKPQPKPSMANKIKIEDPPTDTKGFSAFQGSGQRLNGKSVKSSSSTASDSNGTLTAKLKELSENDDVPAPLNLPFGKLFFGYRLRAPKAEAGLSQPSSTFDGKGYSLK